MTSVLNCLTSSPSNSTARLPPLNLANSKYPTTFIIQPPLSSQTKQSALLTKRYKPAELGDLLMKKIKTQTANSSEAGSQQQSPTLKRFEDPLYDSPSCSKGLEGLESTSMIDEIESPSIKSYCDDTEKADAQKALGDMLRAQRSISTPLVCNPLSLKPFKLTIDDGHKQIKHALDVLQKKMMIDQQATALKEILLKVHRCQEPLNIPPLFASSDSTAATVKKGKIILKNGDEEQEVIYGDVEYPFLSRSVRFNEGDDLKPSGNFSSSSLSLKNRIPSSKSQDSETSSKSSSSSPAYESVKQTEGYMVDFRDSLTATRAETQRSESEYGREMNEKIAEGKRRRNKKATSIKHSEDTEKVKKVQKKEKTKGKKEKSPLLSPVRGSGRRLTERRKNKWQLVQNEKVDQDQTLNAEGTKKKNTVPVGPKYQVDVPSLSVSRQSSERRALKMKSSPLPQDEGELKNFFEGLRNLLNDNIDQEKAVILLKENDDDVQAVLESIQANKEKYIAELTVQSSQ